MKYILLFAASLLFAATSHAGNHEPQKSSAMTVIGTVYTDDGKANPLYAGNIDQQQIWEDYIQAHNDRDLAKISEMNAPDWIGYPASGEVIKGSAAHIEFLDVWFKSPENPTWEISWMIANSGENEDGVMEHWRTTGNERTYLDSDGNKALENEVIDVQFLEGKIKRVYVYSRPDAQE